MKRDSVPIAAAGLAALALVLAACASSSTVQVPTDDSRTAFREMQRLDCRVYDERGSSLSAGINFSQAVMGKRLRVVPNPIAV